MDFNLAINACQKILGAKASADIYIYLKLVFEPLTCTGESLKCHLFYQI